MVGYDDVDAWSMLIPIPIHDDDDDCVKLVIVSETIMCCETSSVLQLNWIINQMIREMCWKCEASEVSSMYNATTHAPL